MHLIYVSGYALFTVSWWRGIGFVSRVRALGFKSWTGQSNSVLLPMARHHSDISLKGVVLLRRNDVELGPANSLHALIYCSKYNEKFDLICFMMHDFI